VKARLLGIFAGFLFAGASFASIDCTFYNVPGGVLPNKGQTRNDSVKFTGLGDAAGVKIAAYWTPFVDLGGEAQTLKVTKITQVDPLRCQSCYDIYASTLGNGSVTEFAISLRDYGPGIAILANIDYRLNSDVSAKWLPFNETPGACFIK
jgi:hypothetical protein